MPRRLNWWPRASPRCPQPRRGPRRRLPKRPQGRSLAGRSSARLLQVRIETADDYFSQVDVIGLVEEEENHLRDVLGVDHRLAFEALAQVGAFDEVGVHAAGTKGVNMDVVRFGFNRQAATEAEQAVFAGAV